MKDNSVQPANPALLKQLDICCKKIAAKVSDEDISEWKNSDYNRLSRQLFSLTKVRLSPETLKRVFGKLKTTSRYYPQQATRDALAQFIGYRDWYEFVLMNPLNRSEPESSQETIDSRVPLAIPVQDIRRKKNKLLAFVIILVFSAAAAAAYFFLSDNDSNGKIKLVCINPEGFSLHSAIFKLANTQEHIPEDLSIGFGDGKQNRRISKGQIVSHYYEKPGRFFPKLYYKGKVIDSTVVYLKTNGWTASVSIQGDTSRYYVLHPQKNISKGIFTAGIDEVTTLGIDTNQAFLVSFNNIKPSQISADNFELSADVKSSVSRPGIKCSQFDILIFGENNRHLIDIMKPECVTWAYYQFSENTKDGEISDLRALGHDLTRGGSIKLTIANKKVRLFINGKMTFSTQYQKPIGKVMGVRIFFSGIGQFSNFRLTDLKTGQSF